MKRTVQLPIEESGFILDDHYVLSTLQVFFILTLVLAGTVSWVQSLRKIKPITEPEEMPENNSTFQRSATYSIILIMLVSRAHVIYL